MLQTHFAKLGSEGVHSYAAGVVWVVAFVRRCWCINAAPMHVQQWLREQRCV
jgi:hypothetical protein